ncbi:MAG TPA: CGNR zinc finger domain-containing protein [Sphingomonas sp.]|uniref:CGNR zinc finger domain-containing protein n=1 Tax=Sphingomonas sp. TaxID=28214 RepID=UPI002B75AF96|nr:CGNR zinc finger domain-containing protein [Sphingomonas sp.]HMI18965.1 CGNR zinc finger domain-containing protein [Sphingomonas sp.]
MTDPLPRPISAIRLDGGRLCIDFVNTIHDRSAVVAEDYLATPERYAEWARRTGAVGADEEVRLPRSRDARAGLMADMRILRDAIYRLLIATLDGTALPADALRTANAWLLEARKGQALAGDGQLILRADPGDAYLPLKRIALDLVDTLAQAHAGQFRLARCANQTSCGWLFADTSKNGRRRWCAMETCGVASKMATLRRRSAAVLRAI